MQYLFLTYLVTYDEKCRRSHRPSLIIVDEIDQCYSGNDRLCCHTVYGIRYVMALNRHSNQLIKEGVISYRSQD